MPLTMANQAESSNGTHAPSGAQAASSGDVGLDESFESMAESFKPSEAVQVVKPKLLEVLPICEQGPCQHLTVVEMPVGNTDDFGNRLTSTQRRCWLGVDFTVGTAIPAGVTQKIALQSVVLPVKCNQWSPWTDAELEDVEARRVDAQVRLARDRAAEAAFEQEEPLPQPVDVGAGIADAPAEDLPDTFDELTKENL